MARGYTPAEIQAEVARIHERVASGDMTMEQAVRWLEPLGVTPNGDPIVVPEAQADVETPLPDENLQRRFGFDIDTENPALTDEIRARQGPGNPLERFRRGPNPIVGDPYNPAPPPGAGQQPLDLQPFSPPGSWGAERERQAREAAARTPPPNPGAGQQPLDLQPFSPPSPFAGLGDVMGGPDAALGNEMLTGTTSNVFPSAEHPQPPAMMPGGPPRPPRPRPGGGMSIEAPGPYNGEDARLPRPRPEPPDPYAAVGGPRMPRRHPGYPDSPAPPSPPSFTPDERISGADQTLQAEAARQNLRRAAEAAQAQPAPPLRSPLNLAIGIPQNPLGSADLDPMGLMRSPGFELSGLQQASVPAPQYDPRFYDPSAALARLPRPRPKDEDEDEAIGSDLPAGMEAVEPAGSTTGTYSGGGGDTDYDPGAPGPEPARPLPPEELLRTRAQLSNQPPAQPPLNTLPSFVDRRAADRGFGDLFGGPDNPPGGGLMSRFRGLFDRGPAYAPGQEQFTDPAHRGIIKQIPADRIDWENLRQFDPTREPGYSMPVPPPQSLGPGNPLAGVRAQYNPPSGEPYGADWQPTTQSRRPGFRGLFDREHFQGGPGMTDTPSITGVDYTKSADPGRGRYKYSEHEKLGGRIGRTALGVPALLAGGPAAAAAAQKVGGIVGRGVARGIDPNRSVFGFGQIPVIPQLMAAANRTTRGKGREPAPSAAIKAAQEAIDRAAARESMGGGYGDGGGSLSGMSGGGMFGGMGYPGYGGYGYGPGPDSVGGAYKNR